jgi:long-chain fatty acid transport protein
MNKSLSPLGKRFRRHRASVTVLMGVGVVISSTAVAGGILGYEVGTAEVGLASAGWGARAQDASTLFTNVAGMTRLDGDQALGGLQILYGSVSFSPSSSDPRLGTDDGGNAASWFGNASGFYTHSLSRDLKVGIGLAGNFGAKLSYDDNWIGRYYGQRVTLVGLSILPSVAYRVNDQWSVGLSLNAMPTKLKDDTAINNILVASDGQFEYKDTEVGWGGNLGLLYELSPATRVGFTYNSEVKLSFSDTPTFTGIGPLISAVAAARGLTSKNVTIHTNVPQQFMLSGFHQLNERLALLASAGWQNWSQLGQLEIGVDSRNARVVSPNLPLKNTWHGALGAQIKLNGDWLLNTGIAYDSKFQDALLSPVLPVNDSWRFGLGAETELAKALRWGFSAEYLDGGSPTLSVQGAVPVILGGRGSFSGTYSNEYIVYVSSYLSYKF